MGQQEEREPGFLGMVAAGETPREAWEKIRAELAADPEARALITALAGDPQGRAALAGSRQRWAAHGLPPPWEDAVAEAGGDNRGEHAR